MAGPSNPHKRLPTSELAARGIAGKCGGRAGPDARRRRDHRGHHQLHQHQQPAQRDRRRPARAQRERARPRRASRGSRSSLAPGSKAVQLYLRRSRPAAGARDSWASASSPSPARPATACRGALDPAIQQEIIERDLYATAVLSGNRNFDGRIHPYAKQAFLASPPLVVAYAIAGTVRFDIEKDVLGIDARRPAGHAEGHLAERCGDRRDRRVERQARALPQGLRADVRARRSTPASRSARCTTGARRAPTSAARRTGKARWPASAR